eukprot:m.532404 g.532404  ORF g.532404 m.532404 type:complete len:321 (-) comp22045_c0_seq2:487-1449(-)
MLPDGLLIGEVVAVCCRGLPTNMDAMLHAGIQGMQSGMIFLFPHILKVVYSAETCKTLDFDSRINMWFNPAMPQTQLRFPCTVDPAGEAPTLWEMYYKIFWPTIIWGIGTAAGEIPPYHFAYLAASRGEVDDEWEKELNSLETDRSSASMAVNMFTEMKSWMIRFIQNNGFLGVYLMAAWPNAAFDLCGMCCGHFQMEFWTFFGAVLLGKAFTLRPIQAILFVMTFSHVYRPMLIETVAGAIPVVGEQTGHFLAEKIETFITNVESGGDNGSGGMGAIATVWALVVLSLITYFIKGEHVSAMLFLRWPGCRVPWTRVSNS